MKTLFLKILSLKQALTTQTENTMSIKHNPYYDQLTDALYAPNNALVPMVIEQSGRGERSFDIFHAYCVSESFS